MKTKAVLITVCVALAVLCSGSAVLADTLPSFSASVTGGPSVSGSSAVSTAFSNSVPFHDTISGDAGTLSGDESANAGPGGVEGSSVSSISMSGGSGVITGLGPVATSTLSNATYNDFMITGPGTSVPGALSLSLNGTFETTASISDSIPNVNHQGGAIIDVGVAGSVAGTGFSGVFHQQSGATGAGSNGTLISASGVFTGDSAPTGFTIPIVLPVGTAFTISLTLGTDAQAFYDGANTGVQGETTTADLRAVSNFFNTFSFPTSGPFFNLPAGYTVNSVSADIVNNQFVGGAPVVTAPEPSTLFLALGAMALLLPLSRHRLL